MKVLALDFEGTHKEPRRGCPIQLGVAVMDKGEVLSSAEWLIKPPTHWKTGKPTREVDAYALRVSGLDLSKIEAEGLSSLEACGALQSWVRENQASSLPVLAFSMSYDIECYENLLYDGGYFDFNDREYYPYHAILGAKWICVRQAARRLLSSELLRFSLDEVAEHFGRQRTGEAHGALEDAILAGKVYQDLLDMVAAVPA